jgi:hypothetical protein
MKEKVSAKIQLKKAIKDVRIKRLEGNNNPQVTESH